MDSYIYIDNTILEATEKCSTWAVMGYVLDYRSTEPKDAANVGSAFHKGFEYHFKGYGIEDCLAAFRAEYYNLLGDSPVVEERLGYLNCETILREWLKRHPLEKLPFVVEAALVESGVCVWLDDGKEFAFYAKIDAPVRDRETQQPWPLDHKTTGRINMWWTRKFKMGSQMSGYVWAEGQRTGEIVPGAFINAVQVDLLPNSSRKCATHKVKYSECSAQHVVHQLFMVPRSPEAIAGWHRNAVAAAMKFRMLKKAYPIVEFMPAVPQEGQFSGACVFCEFKDWCAMGRPLDKVGVMFVKERWAPWEGGAGERK